MFVLQLWIKSRSYCDIWLHSHFYFYLFVSGVKNDGMSDQVNPNQQRAGSVGRPSSAKSNRERQERILQLKEKQDNERVKKLEELKEQVSYYY